LTKFNLNDDTLAIDNVYQFVGGPLKS